MGKALSIDRAAADQTVEKNVKVENELIQSARSGDIRSFSALVQIYQERAVHIAYSFLGNFEDARDIAQEAFVKAYENLGTFKAESRFYTWFYRILVNACKDFLRKKKVRQHLSFWFHQDNNGDEEAMLNVADHEKNALEQLENRELGNEITKALEKLPDQQRYSFSLRYLEGLSIEEIAENMDLSTGAVKAHLWQAGQKMQKFLSGILSIGG